MVQDARVAAAAGQQGALRERSDVLVIDPLFRRILAQLRGAVLVLGFRGLAAERHGATHRKSDPKGSSCGW